MKICFLADGESIHTKRWCNFFASLGHEIHLITFRNVVLDGTIVHFVDTGNLDVKGGNWKVVLSAFKIRRIVNSIKPDVLHAHYATSYGFTGALCGYRPFVVTALGSDVLISPDHSFVYRMVLKYVFSRADWITAMADHMREKMISLGAAPEKTDTVIFGIDTSIFNLKGRNLQPGKFIITSTRNFEPVYNVQHLIEAVAKVKEKIPGIFLNLIGSGSLFEELVTLVKKRNLSDSVRFFGKVSQRELADVLHESHLFVSVSLSDGNNISLNEAMACGALCIATDIPANRQWISDMQNGFLVPVNNVDILADKIIFSLRDFQQLSFKFIPLNAEIIAGKADWKKNMMKVEEHYRKLAEQK